MDNPATTKHSSKSLAAQIDVVAEFHAHKIAPQRIAYRTGIDLQLVTQLLAGDCHQRLFTARLNRHRRSRREQRLQQSLNTKGIAQAVLQEQIEQEFLASLNTHPHPAKSRP